MKKLINCLLLVSTLTFSNIALADDSPLAEQMETVNDSYKAMGKEADATKGAALARQAQTAMIKSLEFKPEAFERMFPDKTAAEKAIIDYRRMIGESFVIFCKVETAFLEGKNEDVKKLLADAKELKKAGHEKFMEE